MWWKVLRQVKSGCKQRTRLVLLPILWISVNEGLWSADFRSKTPTYCASNIWQASKTPRSNQVRELIGCFRSSSNSPRTNPLVFWEFLPKNLLESFMLIWEPSHYASALYHSMYRRISKHCVSGIYSLLLHLLHSRYELI